MLWTYFTINAIALIWEENKQFIVFRQNWNSYAVYWVKKIIFVRSQYSKSWTVVDINEDIKLKKKRMSSGSCLTSKLYDKIIKMPSKSHETIPLKKIQKYWSRNYMHSKYCNSKLETNEKTNLVCSMIGIHKSWQMNFYWRFLSVWSITA
jgi:hypothetical protein